MSPAEEDCEAYKQLAPRVLGWSRQVSLLSLDAEFAAEQERIMPWVTRSLVVEVRRHEREIHDNRHYVSARTGCYHYHPVFTWDYAALCLNR